MYTYLISSLCRTLVVKFKFVCCSRDCVVHCQDIYHLFSLLCNFCVLSLKFPPSTFDAIMSSSPVVVLCTSFLNVLLYGHLVSYKSNSTLYSIHSSVVDLYLVSLNSITLHCVNTFPVFTLTSSRVWEVVLGLIGQDVTTMVQCSIICHNHL